MKYPGRLPGSIKIQLGRNTLFKEKNSFSLVPTLGQLLQEKQVVQSTLRASEILIFKPLAFHSSSRQLPNAWRKNKQEIHKPQSREYPLIWPEWGLFVCIPSQPLYLLFAHSGTALEFQSWLLPPRIAKT